MGRQLCALRARCVQAWNAKKQRLTIAVLLAFALPPAATRLIGGIKLVETAVPGLYAVVREVSWVKAVSIS